MWISQFIFSIGLGVFAYYFISILRSFLLHVKVFVLSKCSRSEIDFTRKYGSWAVVTGASAGIGSAFAKELASKRMNIVLISYEEEDLKRVAAEIERKFSVQTKIIHVDFTSGEHVYEIIRKELEDLQIGILVNNVGIHKPPAPALEMKADFMQKMVLVNCIPVIMMTKLVLPGMIRNRRGAIVNVSSMADLQPTPLLALYSATKAFVTFFTKAIQFENCGSGVTIQILSPGAVNTTKTVTGDKIIEDNILVPSPTDYVREAISTLGVLDHTAGYYVHSLVATFFLEMMPASLRMILISCAFKCCMSVKYLKEQCDKIK